MRNRDVSSLTGLCGAVLLHLAFALGMTWDHCAQKDRWLKHVEPLWRPRPPSMFVVRPIPRFQPEQVEPSKPPMPPKPETPKPQIALNDELIKRWFRMGDAAGRGTATHASSGEQPVEGRQSMHDQPWISRDPNGPARRYPNEPSKSLAPEGTGGSAGVHAAQAGPPAKTARAGAKTQQQATRIPPPPAQPTTAAPPPPAAVVRANTTNPMPIASATQKPTGQSQPASRPTRVAFASSRPAEVPSPAARPSTTPPENAATAAAISAAGQPGPPGRPNQPADPAPETDSEVDAFTTVGSARMKAGKMDVRLGRKFKTVRPRLTLKGELDVMSLVNPSVKLAIHVDETGKVTDVKVIHSSGSQEIDLPVMLAIYKWWIEPRTNKAGVPRPDMILFTISFK